MILFSEISKCSYFINLLFHRLFHCLWLKFICCSWTNFTAKAHLARAPSVPRQYQWVQVWLFVKHFNFCNTCKWWFFTLAILVWSIAIDNLEWTRYLNTLDFTKVVLVTSCIAEIRISWLEWIVKFGFFVVTCGLFSWCLKQLSSPFLGWMFFTRFFS